MSFTEIYEQFVTGMLATGPLEYIAVVSGIVSVWYSRKEDILVYPTGLLNTTIYVYLSLQQSLFGEASVNFYYTVMSIYGWILWAKRNELRQHVVRISFSDRKWWLYQLGFFASFYVVIYLLLTYLKRDFAPGAIPWGDAFASASAFTGMWLMTKKKVESWIWWLITDFASIPLYFTKHFVFTSVYYFILFIMAIFGLIEWRARAKKTAVT